MKFLFPLLFLFLSTTFGFTQQKKHTHTISGFVYEEGSKESLIGVVVKIPSLKKSTVTNNYGFYSITIEEKDSLLIQCTVIGYDNFTTQINVNKDTTLTIFLNPTSFTTEEIIVTAKKQATTKESDESQMSKIDLTISDIKDIPALLGEKDVMKVIQLMPGVQKGSEGSSGVYVRGGGPDQNLIILDDAPVYNANHLFGFFSLFNGNGIKSVELYKGGFPAKFGGRLSSVIDINMKDGNKKELRGEVGVGLISSKITLEGPISKKKPSSFIISGRRTYLDVLARPFMTDKANGGYYFYDLNVKTNIELNPNNKIYLSGYFGKDKFYANSKTQDNNSENYMNWGNATSTLRWNHLYNNKLFSNTSLVFSEYEFAIGLKDNSFTAKYYSGIQDWILKTDFDYSPRPEHSIKSGMQLVYHTFTPGAITSKNSSGSTDINFINKINAIETGIYIEDDIQYKSRIKINPGLRLSYYQSGTLNKILPEPRLSMVYKLKNNLSAKFSGALMNQYIHLLSNTNIGLPTDLWVPSTNKIKPQQSIQFATGIVKDIDKTNLTISAEAYYKTMSNVISYKEGASFINLSNTNTNISWEENITSGKAWSYGSEFLIRKKEGKLTGWVGYTLSWTQMQFDELNYGNSFYAKYDRRHDISVVGIYKLIDNDLDRLKQGITITGTWVYGTGNALTMPISSYNSVNGMQVNSYSARNSIRAEAYHRMDLGIQWHKRKQKGERTWELSLYNAYNRANPFFYYEREGKLMKVSLFTIIPSLSYTYKF